jgi:arginyl-tRNA synthetase
MLSFEGNTIIYILYAYVRILSLKNRLGFMNFFEEKSLGKIVPGTIFNSHEKDVLLHLSSFPETVSQFYQLQSPHLMTEYLYTLAQKFHTFFQHCPLKGHDEIEKRLTLAHYTADMLKMGLNLLGCHVVDEM